MNPTSALHEYILNAPLVDTHEHLLTQKEFEGRQDILGILVGHYWGDDLLSADLSIPRVNNWLRSWSIDWEHPWLDGQKNSLAERFHLLKKGIERSLHTSNGKAASHTMRKVFGQEAVDLGSLEAAQAQLDSDYACKSRLELLRDVAGIDHVQADHWFLNIEPDAEDAEFFLYDLSVHPYTNLPFDELATRNFVRRFLNAVPYNKLFVFGGDTGSPYSVNGYAMQAREGLNETLQECVCSGDFNTPVALEIAEHLMLKNAYECFDLTATRSALRDRAESQPNRIV